MSEGESNLRELQIRGIQTATDLQSAYDAAVGRDEQKRRRAGDAKPDQENGAASEVAAFLRLLEGAEGPDRGSSRSSA